MSELMAIQDILKRERQARKAAESVIESKSRELFYANEQLRKLNESLEETIRERTVELIAARDRAEKATQAKSEFLSSMSHEIRTPLNAISGLSELIEKDSQEPEIREFAEIIRDSVNHLLVIINEILDFSKIESGKFQLEEQDFLLHDLHKQIFHTYDPLARKKNLDLVIEFDPGIPKVIYTDKTKLMQVWINLLGNAIKFTETGRVEARLSFLKQENDLYWLQGSVKDTGPGISAEDQAKIFLPFEQADQTAEQKIGGTGLGLAITFRIVELMGGHIDLASTPGKGSEFRFRIPVKAGDPALLLQKQSQHAARAFTLEGLKVLVVDDMEMNRFLMKKVLGRVNAIGTFAENGAVALELLRKQSFDVILMDLHMPVMDGREATRIIRQEALPVANPNIPIIALTADAFKHTEDSVLEAGMNDFIAKPIHIDTLYEKLKILL